MPALSGQGAAPGRARAFSTIQRHAGDAGRGAPSPGLLTDLYHPDAPTWPGARPATGSPPRSLYLAAPSGGPPPGGRPGGGPGLRARLPLLGARPALPESRCGTTTRRSWTCWAGCASRRHPGDAGGQHRPSRTSPCCGSRPPSWRPCWWSPACCRRSTWPPCWLPRSPRITTAARGAGWRVRLPAGPGPLHRLPLGLHRGLRLHLLRRRRGALPAAGHGHHLYAPGAAFDSEREAFQAVAESYNRYTVLLDTTTCGRPSPP